MFASSSNNYPKHLQKLAVAVVLLIVALIATFYSHLAGAHDYRVGQIQIVHPWSRATAPGSKVAAAFFTLKNKGKSDTLISARASVSEAVEIHEMKMDAGTMRMRAVESLEIAANASVELKPGGYHIMFINLKAPLEKGKDFPMVLKFAQAGEVTVQVKVGGMGSGNEHAH